MLIFTANFEGVSKLKTKLKLVFSIKDFTEDDDLRLTQFIDSPGSLLFTPDTLKREVIEAAKNREIGKTEGNMSPSATLRGEIYKTWANVYEGKLNFEEYYVKVMNRVILQIQNHRNEKERNDHR
jgi:hypothetical protein